MLYRLQCVCVCESDTSRLNIMPLVWCDVVWLAEEQRIHCLRMETSYLMIMDDDNNIILWCIWYRCAGCMCVWSMFVLDVSIFIECENAAHAQRTTNTRVVSYVYMYTFPMIFFTSIYHDSMASTYVTCHAIHNAMHLRRLQMCVI